MAKLIPVEGHNGLFRDANSNAIVSVDDEQRRLEKKKNAAIRERLNASKTQANEINSLKQDVSELKELLKILLNKLENNNG